LVLNVLLFSPLAERDPPSGDVSYTEALLACPPSGVRYVTYAEALACGDMVVRGRWPRHRRWSAIDAAIFGVRGVERLVRDRVMFREPIWFVSIAPGVFDLVHQHQFPVMQIGNRVPVVSSAGYPLSMLYLEREQWSERRTDLATTLEEVVCRSLGVRNPWLRCRGPDVMTVYTERFRRWLVERGVSSDRILVSGTAIPEVSPLRRVTECATVGFIGRDFERKGGDVAALAFERIRKTRPDLKLLVVTSSAAKLDLAPSSNVEIVRDAPRSEVLSKHLPRIDILLAPSRSDCGAPIGVLEALQSGVPVITSDCPWLDERLVAPAVLRSPAEPAHVAADLENLLSPGQLSVASAAASALWREEFSMPALHRSLIPAYEQAIGRAQLMRAGS
jgi:glycosyltransferase involved in cell wall biosynthesis